MICRLHGLPDLLRQAMQDKNISTADRSAIEFTQNERRNIHVCDLL